MKKKIIIFFTLVLFSALSVFAQNNSNQIISLAGSRYECYEYSFSIVVLEFIDDIHWIKKSPIGNNFNSRGTYRIFGNNLFLTFNDGSGGQIPAIISGNYIVWNENEYYKIK